MKKRHCFYAIMISFIFFIVWPIALYSETLIEITTHIYPPLWAIKEQQLLKESAAACSTFFARYFDERGYIQCVISWGGNDGPDDAMENIHNWTLLHALGAPDKVLEMHNKIWEGHLKQYTKATAETVPITKDGMYYKEFIVSFDWEHTMEGLAAFHMYGLSKPDDPKWQERVRRFAGFYLNEDPEAQNYDPVHKIILSLHNGSKGPKLTPATENDWGGDPIPGQPERLTRYSTASNIVGDHPLNLCATALAMNAYMLDHTPKYKLWLIDYTDAWRDRIIANGGNIPTNIGLDGTIGGEWDGKWYGGIFGWNFWPQQPGRNYYARGPQVGFGIAFILSGGEQQYVDVLRMQVDNLYAVKSIVSGNMQLPSMYGDNGWYGYTTTSHHEYEYDIFAWSMKQEDYQRISNDSWIRFLNGTNSTYPNSALTSAYSSMLNKVNSIKADQSTPEQRYADTTQSKNPAMVDELVRLMLGGTARRLIGNILHCRLRYFDPVKCRAGIPEDVGALVTGITEQTTTVELVNINESDYREVIVQTGAYGEHNCTKVTIGDEEYPVNHRFFTVRLAPGAGAVLTVFADRYANEPTLAHPWHGDIVPVYVEGKSIPREIKLIGNYPNPFNPGTTILFEVSRNCRAIVNVYTITGQHTETLFDDHVSPGHYSVKWKPENEAAGMYLYTLETGNQRDIGKMLFIK